MRLRLRLGWGLRWTCLEMGWKCNCAWRDRGGAGVVGLGLDGFSGLWRIGYSLQW